MSMVLVFNVETGQYRHEQARFKDLHVAPDIKELAWILKLPTTRSVGKAKVPIEPHGLPMCMRSRFAFKSPPDPVTRRQH